MTNAEQAAKDGVPSVHLNGTSREELERQYREAHEAITDAIKTIAANYPHMRDYYIQGPTDKNGFLLATHKHQFRLNTLQAIADDIADDYDKFMKANPDRFK